MNSVETPPRAATCTSGSAVTRYTSSFCARSGKEREHGKDSWWRPRRIQAGVLWQLNFHASE
jgi:hypothetical protein